jgi:phosphate/sulfate permease
MAPGAASSTERRIVGLTIWELRRRNGIAGVVFGVLAAVGCAAGLALSVKGKLGVVILALVVGPLFGVAAAMGVIAVLHVVTRLELRARAQSLGAPAEKLLQAWDEPRIG